MYLVTLAGTSITDRARLTTTNLIALWSAMAVITLIGLGFYLARSISRPLAEFRMLAGLSDMGLPVPAPLAALCARQGLRYRGWLLLERILQVVPLADLIMERADDDSLWRRCGAVIRRFHAAGVVHADLNARNILVGQGPAVHLVDFDRARLAANDAAAFRANLARLRRSLEKLWPDPLRDRLEGCWRQLEGGYAQAGEAV